MAASDVSSEFDYQRKKAAQQETANLQAQKDALARRAASQGGGPSGAFVKLENQATDESAQRLGDANEAINTAQRAEERRIREIDEGRKYQTSERLGSQEFANQQRLGSQDWQGSQGALQRAWQTGERMGSQDFSHGERLGAQDFSKGMQNAQFDFQHRERQGSQDWQSQEAAKGRDWQSSEAEKNFGRQVSLQEDVQLHDDYERTKQLALAYEQLGLARDQFDYEKNVVDPFNMDMATKMMNQKDPIEQLLNPGGMMSQRFGKNWMVGVGGQKIMDTLGIDTSESGLPYLG